MLCDVCRVLTQGAQPAYTSQQSVCGLVVARFLGVNMAPVEANLHCMRMHPSVSGRCTRMQAAGCGQGRRDREWRCMYACMDVQVGMRRMT